VTAPELPLFSEAEGLNTSAVAVALTEFPLLPQIREKNVGSAARWIRTVTNGLMAKVEGRPEQSELPVPDPPVPTLYVTVMTVGEIEPTEFCPPAA
jgi:hypothetical protein